jgi:hypothetical protein
VIDWAFLAKLEEPRLRAYVPVDKQGEPIERSGVTVATGVDLGQMSGPEIMAMGLGDDLKDALASYAGMRGGAALSCLRFRPLVLTEAEALELDAVIQGRHEQALRDAFNAVAGMAGLPFWDDLPLAARTVLFSVSWQYGNLAHKCPRFWRAACTQDWAAVEHELRNFGDCYPTRRHAEADYLAQHLAGSAAA